MVSVDLQNDEKLAIVSEPRLFKQWVESSLLATYDQLEQTIRVVGEPESRALNLQFRGIDRPTNVLAFPSENDYLEYACLGDLVICAPVVNEEAQQQAKSPEAHWAHMVVHGMLHLQGYHHEDEIEAAKMEAVEIKILSTLGYSNPYND
ncbi:MAG: rRNA maturation RNase YbeY [Gammaproteobacteria bacterium]|nr:MAG: rRNA maturation RNase YbeY [Gammaproteobacteria bacterium]